LKTYTEYPPRQRPGSFALHQVLAKLQEAGPGRGEFTVSVVGPWRRGLDVLECAGRNVLQETAYESDTSRHLGALARDPLFGIRGGGAPHT
jgi:hypothetical protein